MRMFMKKRQVLAATLVVALAAAVAVNWYYSKTETAPEGESIVAENEVQGNLGDSLLVAGTAQNEDAAVNGQAEDAAQTGGSSKQYFSDAKLRQSKRRDDIKDEIESLMEADAMDDNTRQKLLSLLSQLDTLQKMQTDCETLIAAKLGGDCVVVIDEERAEVIVEKGKVNDNALLQIAEIMEQSAGVSVENLSVIEAK